MTSHRAARFVQATMIALLLSACTAQPSRAATYEVGPNARFKNLSEVATQLGDGDRVRIAPGEYFDCAVIAANNVTIEGTGANGAAVLTDRTCQGKAILVTTGNNITIRNLTLTRARVADFNGAGIRNESPTLTVDAVRFINNQNGILTGGPANGGTMTVRNSYFERNGTCERSCSHGIYANNLALLRVEGSTFVQTRQAHHIKSRAARTEVINNNISDGPEGTASYHIDIPNGGNLLVRGNTMVKGPKAENRSAAIMIGAEGVTQPTREIRIENNDFRNEGNFETAFVENRTAEDAILIGNKISGMVKPLRGDGVVRP
jgi:hypothetical protein